MSARRRSRRRSPRLAALDLPPDTPVAVSYGHPHAGLRRYRDPALVARRKPSGAMLRELAAVHPAAAAAGVHYVGDCDDDRAAAADAGAAFTPAGSSSRRRVRAGR